MYDPLDGHNQAASCYHSCYELAVQQYFSQTTNNCCREHEVCVGDEKQALEDGHEFMGCESMLFESIEPELHNYHSFPRHPNKRHDHDDRCMVCDPFYWSPATTVISTDKPTDSTMDFTDRENTEEQYSLGLQQRQAYAANSQQSTSSSQTMEIVKRVRDLELGQGISSDDTSVATSCSFQTTSTNQPDSSDGSNSSNLSFASTNRTCQSAGKPNDSRVFQFVDNSEISVNQDEMLSLDYKPIFFNNDRTIRKRSCGLQTITYEPTQIRRKRKKTEKQLLILENAFKESPLLNQNQRADLARLADLDTEEVKLWFKYRRHRARNATRVNLPLKRAGSLTDSMVRSKFMKYSDSD